MHMDVFLTQINAKEEYYVIEETQNLANFGDLMIVLATPIFCVYEKLVLLIEVTVFPSELQSWPPA